jgi:hypothetical protein
MTPEAAVDTLVKTAALPSYLQELLTPTGTTGMAVRNGLLGAGAGGLLGAYRESRKNEEDRNYGGGVARGAVFGGLLGGAGTVAVREGLKSQAPTGDELKKMRIQKDDQGIVERANHARRRMEGDPTLGDAPPPRESSPDKTILGNLLGHPAMPPAVQLGTHHEGGGGIWPAIQSYFPGIDTPEAAGATAANTAGIVYGGWKGMRAGNTFQQHLTTRPGLGTKHAPTRGLFRATPGSKAFGRPLGGILGAVIGAGIGGTTTQGANHGARYLYDRLLERK